MSWQEELQAALVDAFTPAEFDRMVDHINRRRTDYSTGGPTFPDVVHEVVRAADGDGWARELTRGALWFKSGNTLLQRVREANPLIAPTFLKESERGEIVAGIQSAFPAYADLGAVVAGCGGPALDAMVERSTTDPPADWALRLVQWFDRRGAVALLIDHCLKARPEPVLQAAAKNVLAAIKAREVAAGYRLADPYETCLVEGQVFLDRQVLRAALRGWSPTPRKRVLVVDGPTRSGKTYTLQLLRHIAVQMRTIQIVDLDLAEEDVEMLELGALARRVMLKMGRPRDLEFMPKRKDAGSETRWSRELCDWLVAAARESATTWVFVLDGTHHPRLRDALRDMIRELVRRAAAPDSPLRVVLLGYTEDLLPIDVRARIATEQLQALTQQDLHDFLVKVVDQLGVEPESGVFDEIVADVVARTGLASIESVAGEVQRWIDDLQGATP